MKRLLHALYITEPDVVVRGEGESLLAVRGDGQKTVFRCICWSKSSAFPALPCRLR